jgi:hypothetical protein
VIEAVEEEFPCVPAALVAGLRQLGHEVDDTIPPQLGLSEGYGFVRFPYTIKLGSRAGEIVPIAFIAPGDFPVSPPGGIYVHGDVRPLSQAGELPHGGVSDASSQLGDGWRYWSRAHDAWPQSSRDAKAWMKHVDRLFLDL